MSEKKYNFPLGELNPIYFAGTTRNRSISRNNIIDNPLACHRRTLKGNYSPQLFHGAKSFKAIVLKVVNVNISKTPLGNILSRLTPAISATGRQNLYICRIPEVHAHLPDPFAATTAEDRIRICDMYPTFYPIKQASDGLSLSTIMINPGSIVEVEFSDSSMSNGTLKSVIKKSEYKEIPESEFKNFQFKHGELNPTQFAISHGATYSSKNIIDSPSAVYRDMASRAARQTMFKKGKVFKAVVLKHETPPANSVGLIKLIVAAFRGASAIRRPKIYTCRVPELHAHLPNPLTMKDEDKSRVIEYFPKFLNYSLEAGSGIHENVINEGSIVEVEFADLSFGHGVVRKIVKANQNIQTPTSNPSAQQAHNSGAASTVNEKVALSKEAQFKADNSWTTESEAKVYGILSADFDRRVKEGALTQEQADEQLATVVGAWHSNAIGRGDAPPLVVAPGQETPTVPIVLVEQAE